MKKVLLVTSVKFWRLQNGAASRIYTLSSVLHSAGFDVGLFFVGSLDRSDDMALDNLNINCRTCAIDGATLTYLDFIKNPLTTLFNFPRYLLKIWYRVRKKNFPFQKFHNSSVLRKFNEYLKYFDPSCVLVEYIRFSYLLPRAKDSRCLWLIDTHDVMHKRCAMFKELSIPHWVEISREEEVGALSGFDAVIAIQFSEEQLLRNMVKDARVILVQHSVEVNSPQFPKRNFDNFTVGYLAANNHTNCDSIVWFLDKVWPKCIEKDSKLFLHIGGSICRKLEGRLDRNVKLLGYIDEVDCFYNNVDIVVNPVRSGGGLKIKNVESLAFGRPLITTIVGSDGFPCSDVFPFLIANTEIEFADNIIKLKDDESARNALSKRSIDYIEKNFSHDSVYKPLLDFIEKVP